MLTGGTPFVFTRIINCNFTNFRITNCNLMICPIVIFPRLRVVEHGSASSAVFLSFDGSFPGVRTPS